MRRWPTGSATTRPLAETTKLPRTPADEQKGTVLGFSLIVISCVGGLALLSPRPETIPNGSERPREQQRLAAQSIRVTSLNVKQLGGKFRYFFQIRNEDSEPFNGDVTIGLERDDGGTVWFETFTTSQAMRPGGTNFVYTDANTGPTVEFGEFKVSAFEYTAHAKGRQATEARGAIS